MVTGNAFVEPLQCAASSRAVCSGWPAYLRLRWLGGLELVEVVKKIQPSVVRIDTDAGLGSGVVVNDNGWVLTCFHVIDDARQVKITLHSGKVLDAHAFLAVDPGHDLALLKADRLDGLSVKIAGRLPEIGEKVAAFENPKGFSFSTSEGIVAAIRSGKDLIESIGRDAYAFLGYREDATWIQTTAPISPGNSDGPLVNMDAELVGLNSRSHIAGQNLNFAI